MSSSSLSSSSTKTTISGDRPSRTLLVNVHNQMMMITTDKQQNNSNSIINDHSPPSTPSKSWKQTEIQPERTSSPNQIRIGIQTRSPVITNQQQKTNLKIFVVVV